MKVISSIEFGVYSPEQVRKMSAAKITVPDTYDEDGYPINGGLADQRLGVIDPGLKCKTCGGRMKSCSGHFGNIELVRPVIHVGYAKTVYQVLKSICRRCSRLLNEDSTLEKVKRTPECPHCGEKQGAIKFVKPTTFFEDDRRLLANEVRERLEHMSDEDLATLGVKIRLEWVVLTVLLVPPVTVRPSITLETGERSEDDLTHKLVDILRINQRLGENIDAGAPQLIIEDLWELLQYHVATFFDNETSGIPPARHRSGRQLKTLFQRLKGKEGRFRYNLSGKRVNFSARTVISPDQTLGINELGVPQAIASELTVPVQACEWNLENMKQFIKEKSALINYVIRPDGKRKKLTNLNLEEILGELAAGYVVERQLMDGDVVIFNRQPSLHKVSMMAHYVRVLPGKTFRFNVADCRPYNADYDGDEMNIHVPQTEEAQAEAEILMRVQDQILSPRNGEPIIVPDFDQVSGVYLLTIKQAAFSRQQAVELLEGTGVAGEFEGDKVAGREIYSLLLPEDLDFECRNRSYHRDCKDCVAGKCGEHDSRTVIKKGRLSAGHVDAKASDLVVGHIFKRYGSDAARNYLDKITKASVNVSTSFGLSLSPADYKLDEKAGGEIHELYEEARKGVRKLVKKYKTKKLQRQPGKSLRDTLEEKVMGILEKVRHDCWNIVRKHIHQTTIKFGLSEIEVNPALLMANAGARGKPINVIQMAGLVGQQAVRGKRMRSGYKNRILSHFARGALGDRERGFVKNSYIQGLSPVEYFFHAAGGRDSVVDKGVNPAKTGYMQRRLVNALQDMIVEENKAVYDAEGNVIQFKYGDDGNYPTNDPIAYGEPVGVIAAQSIGEPGTQMSTSFDERVIVKKNDEVKVVEIGAFVDELMRNHPAEVLNNATEWCDIPERESIFVPSLNQSGRVEWKRLLSCSRHWHGEKLLKIRTRSGREIKATANHSFVTRINNKIVPVVGNSLKIGQRLPVLKRMVLEGCKSSLSFGSTVNTGAAVQQVVLNKVLLDEKFGWFVGAYLSEGHVNGNKISISNTDENFLSAARGFGNNAGIAFSERDCKGEYGPSHSIDFKNKELAKLIQKECGTGSYNKKVPEFAYSGSDAFIGALLRGYFEGDGNINFEREVIRAHSRSKQLIDGISLLLNRLGIFARKKIEVADGKEIYLLHISKRYAKIFMEKVGFDSVKKSKLLEKLARLENKDFTYDSVEMITGFGNGFKETARKLGLVDKTSVGAGIRKFSRKQKIGTESLRRYVELFERTANEKRISVSGEINSLKSFLNEDVVWDEIVEIARVENDKQVYDFSVEGLETFTTFDGVVTHNTLRTFHYAGVASLAQLGFTRLVEIVDATKSPKSPVMEVYLKKEYAKDFDKVKKIAAGIEQLTLEQVAEVSENFDRKSIRIVFDEKALKERGFKLEELYEKIKEIAPFDKTQTGVTVKPKVDSIKNTRKITTKLREILMRGVPGISRAIIIEKDGEYTLATEGSNLAGMLKVPEVDASRTTTNNIMEISHVLGIEAGRNAIVNEVMKVLDAQGLKVDVRHIMLIADSMTCKGKIKSIGRHGLAGEKASVLARAAFEETAKHLLNASVKGEEDTLRGVTENIIIGQTIPLGTGKVKLEMQVE